MLLIHTKLYEIIVVLFSVVFNVCVNVICRDACFAICLIKFLICSFLFYCSIVAVLYIVKYRLDNIDVIYVPISLWMNACRALGNYIANISNTFMEEKKQQKFDMPIVHWKKTKRRKIVTGNIYKLNKNRWKFSMLGKQSIGIILSSDRQRFKSTWRV